MKRSIIFFIFVAMFFPGGILLDQIRETSLLLHAQEEATLDIVIVLDNSGSMKKNDPHFLAREIVTRALIDLGEDSRLGMVIFDQQARLVVNLTETASSEARARFFENLDRVDYRGLYSDTAAAVERAIYELKTYGRKGSRKAIILLTDGIVDTGDKQRDFERGRWLKEELTRESKRTGIRIIGVAFTDTADFSLIQKLALETDGDYFRVYRAERIQDVFGQVKELISRPLLGSPKETIPVEPAAPSVEPEPVIVPEALMAPVTRAAPEVPAIQETVPKMETGLASQEEKVQTQKSTSPMAPILIGAIVILGIIVVLIISNRKSRVYIAKDTVKGTPVWTDMPRAELLDVKNVTGMKTLPLSNPINRIGRDPTNDIHISRDPVSALHATIEYRDGFFYLEDQRSKNGTHLSGKMIEPNSPRKLKSGDEIRFDGYRFIFLMPDQIPAGETAFEFGATSATIMRERQPVDASTPSSVKADSIPQAMLIDVKNITGRKTMRLDKGINRIGRGPGNDIDIQEDAVSGFHATIEHRDGFFYLEDQRSRNSTSLNGEEIESNSPKKLKSGDEIMFDVHKFIFLLEYQQPSGDTGEKTKGL
ncbi:MAG: FHA domain-containing protein [Deltaproteobacteria bacterium]|nr:FHA domain-containing protein [Deltaproteobacteria bacterium]